MVHREKRIAEAMIKNAGGMSMNSSLLLACCFRKKGGGVSNLWCPKVPRPQGIQSNMITFWMLLVSRLWEVPFFFLAELYSHDGTTLGRIRGHVQFAKGMGQNTRHNWFNCEHELPSSNQSWRLWYLYHCKVCHSDLWIGRNLPAQCSVAGPKKLKHKAGESQCPF